MSAASAWALSGLAVAAQAQETVAPIDRYAAQAAGQCTVGSTIGEAAARFLRQHYPPASCPDGTVLTPYVAAGDSWGPIAVQYSACGEGYTHPESMIWAHTVLSQKCPSWGPGVVVLRDFAVTRLSACPLNSSPTADRSACQCLPGFEPDRDRRQCRRVKVVTNVAHPLSTPAADACVGNPIHPLRGVKRETIDTGLSVGGERLVFTYDSTWQLPRQFEGTRETAGSAPTGPVAEPAWAGLGWSASLLNRRLVVAGPLSSSARCTDPSAATAARGDGRILRFARTGQGPFVADAATSEQLLAVTGGYLLRTGLTRERYDLGGRLLRIDRAEGGWVTFAYSDAGTPSQVAPVAGLLITATDHHGRTLRFSYKAPASPMGEPLLATVTDAAGRRLLLGHDERDRLVSVTWTDGRTRTLLYESAALPQALTGIVDEAAARHATFGYDAFGRAISSARAQGAGRATVSYAAAPFLKLTERYDATCDAVIRSVDWGAPQGTTVTSASGAVSSWTSRLVLGRHALTQQSQPAGSGCAASASQQAYDANGNLASQDDFNGNRTCLAHDARRNLQTVRVEGLAGGSACTVTANGVSLPAGSRKISTQWHPQWALRTRLAEPGKLTTYVYHGQPDPLAGNAVASCAPAGARLPDGTPVAVLCRQVEQATLDPDGGAGFSAALDPTVPAREQRWTYNATGQVLTHDGPRTDVADVTTYEYHATTAFTGADPQAVGTTRGDLRQVTLPNGSRVQHTLYNKLGQLLQSQDANGVVSRYAYDARQRLTSLTVGERTTVYEYSPTGLLHKVTQPDGSWVSWRHDDAHRLVEVADHLGNRVRYTLDSAGNRTAEQVLDPGGNLRRALTRSMDVLGRVQQVTGRP